MNAKKQTIALVIALLAAVIGAKDRIAAEFSGIKPLLVWVAIMAFGLFVGFALLHAFGFFTLT